MKRLYLMALAALLTLCPAATWAQDNPEWFTVVLFGDPEYGMGGADRSDNQATRENGMKWARAIINMHNSGRYRFRYQPEGFVPRADMVICMGDVDGDSKRSRTDTEDIFDLFVNAGIPFFTLLGNHDVVPDYWNGGDKGVTWGSNGGQAANEHSFYMSNWYRNDTRNKGYVQDMKIYRHSQGQWQIEPFAFTFKGIRFYMGQTYWFQKPYNAPATIFNSATYYAPNDILRDLTNDVNAHGNDMPAIWVQHYPIDCADRWWTDKNGNGAFMGTQNAPDYTTADDKRNKYKDLISRTKNPHHFSGHQHWTYTSTYTTNGKTFKDYVAPYHATNGGAFIVLCNSRDGVVEVQTVDFGSESVPNNVFGLSELKNGKRYTITTDPGNANRGALVYDATKGNYVCAANVETSATNSTHHWAILSANNSYYLYNVAAKKFATANGNKLTLTDEPTNNSKVAIEFRDSKPGYPWVLRMNGQLLNVNIGSFAPEGLRVGTWGVIDAGNQYAIAEVGDFANLQEAITPLLYPVDNSGRGNSTHADRYVGSLLLQDESTGVTQQIGGLQTGPGQKIYWNKTDRSFVVNAGATIYTHPSTQNMSLLQTCVFIDEDGDGFSNAVDAANHRALEGSDLKSFSAYRFGNQNGPWYYSTGQPSNQYTVIPPKFQAPMRPGNYRMRYVVAWDNIDPRGNATIAADGGIIVDVTLKVQPKAITSLDQLSHDAVYTIRTNVRGNLRHVGDNPHATAVVDGYDATDEGQQWAIVTRDGKTYLYNVHSKTMACRNDDKKLYMVDPPTPDSWMTIVRSNSDDYPWTIKFGTRFLNTTTGSGWGYLVDNGNNGFDDGNRYAITAVDELKTEDALRIEHLLRYSVRENAYGNSTSGNRYTRGIALTEGNGTAQTVNGLQSGYRQAVYWDKTDQKFTCVRGATLTPSFNFGAMNAMQCCVFVDEDGQGFSSHYDAANHRAVAGSDLKTWSGLRFDGKWYNSRGEETNSECREMPPFKAPSAPGTYRMRYMVTWSSAEPRGYDNINAHGGIIVDVTLEVTDKVTDIAQLSPDRTYTISTKTRGNLYYDPAKGDYVNALNTLTYNASDKKQQWSLIPKGDKLYLYNAAARKYVKKGSTPSGAGGDDLVLTDTPDANSEVTIAATGNNNSDYPWYIKVGGRYVNASTSYGTWAPHGVYASGWGGVASQWDDGNQFAIVAVDDFTAQDLTAARTAAAAAKVELNQRGVGYPTTTCAEYAALKRAIDDIEYATSASNDIALRNNLETALAAYRTTNNIELPQTGKYYTIQFVGRDNNGNDYHINLASQDEAGDAIVASTTQLPTPFLAINNGDGTFRLVTYTGKYFRVITDDSSITDRSTTGLSDEYKATLNNLMLKANDVSFKPVGGVRIVGAGGMNGTKCSLIFDKDGGHAHYGDSGTGVAANWTNTTVWTEVPAPTTLSTSARGATLVVNGLAASSAEVYDGDVKVTEGVSVTNNGTSTSINLPASNSRTTYTIFVPGSKAAAAEGDNAATGGMGARMFTHTVDRAISVNVKFVNDETGEETERRVNTCFGTPMAALLAAEYPNCVMTACDHEAVEAAVSLYTIHFMPFYDIELPGKDSERYANNIYLTADGTTLQTIATGQTEGASPVYFDLSDKKFYCRAGATLTAAVGDKQMDWMHSYVYIDENRDGFSVAEADIVDNTLQAGSDIDLRSYTYYNGYNSSGASKSKPCGIGGLPTFTAPTTPGTYRMRYKVDWDCIDPNGNPGDANGRNRIEANGGIIVDVTLEVYTTANLRTDVLGRRGVGYPTTQSTAYANLDAAIATVEGGSTEYLALYGALEAYFSSDEIEPMPDDGQYYEIHRVDDNAASAIFLALQNEGGTFRLVGPKARYYTGAGYTDAYTPSANNLTVVKTGTGINGFGNVKFAGTDAAVRWTAEPAPALLLAQYETGNDGTITMTVPGINTIHVAAYHNDTKVEATVSADDDTQVILPAQADKAGYAVIVGDATVARMYVLADVAFTNNGSEETEVRQLAIPVGTAMADVLQATHPDRVFVSASPERVVAGVDAYTVRFAPDYGVDGLPGVDCRHGQRNTPTVSLAGDGRDAEMIATLQPRETGAAVYWDRTSERFTCIAGETLTAEAGFTNEYNTKEFMHAYVYVDENHDGFAVADGDIVDGTLQTGSGIDLRSFTHYNGHNSAGAETSQSCGAGDLPPFTAPATPGTYRMRYKVDWDCIDPNGNRATDNLISSNGGIIVDVTLEVLPEAHEVAIKDGWGYASYYNSRCNLTVPDGYTAYTFNFDGINRNRIVANAIEDGVIPAGTAVIIKGDDGTALFPTMLPRTATVTANLLRGTDTQQLVTTENDGTLYMLSRTTDRGVGFYQASRDGKSFTNGAHKAYLDLPNEPAAAGIRAFLFSDIFSTDGVATALELTDGDNPPADCYDLSGRRLDRRPQSGVYIKKGQKVVIK